MDNHKQKGNYAEIAVDRVARQLLGQSAPTVLVTLLRTEGSTPRDCDAAMLVTAEEFFGTIGGGQLEWIALEAARSLLVSGDLKEGFSSTRTVPLGPETGQCCGGRVEIMFRPLTESIAAELERLCASRTLPIVQIHGAGHTGKALFRALSALPFDVALIDSRPDMADAAPGQTVVSALPEQQIRSAPPASAFVILTHDHQLDFMLAGEALKRGDAAYVGMIGSKTKRAVFERWLEENEYEPGLAGNLICPIGRGHVKDKRPSVIAALVSAELIRVFSRNDRD